MFAADTAKHLLYTKEATRALTENWKFMATSYFNWGGLIGTLLTIPIAKSLGRRPMFVLYFLASAATIFVSFALPWPPELRLKLYFFDGLTLFGIFGSFTFYLPELFPTRLRATGAGFCYNFGRVVTAIGPFVIAKIASLPGDKIVHVLKAQSMIGWVPLVGLCFLPLIVETKGKALAD
jgi:sugar phosphate permease